MKTSDDVEAVLCFRDKGRGIAVEHQQGVSDSYEIAIIEGFILVPHSINFDRLNHFNFDMLDGSMRS